MNFSDRTKFISPAKSIYINELVYEQKRRGHDIVVLSLGEAFFDLPSFEISQEAIEQGYHYTDSRGLPDLRGRILDYLNSRHKVSGLSAEKNIIISAGSKVLTYISMLLTLDRGDEVILHEPAWLSYDQQASLCGASVKFVHFNATLAEVAANINKQTKLIIINNPNNPAGKIYSFNELSDLINEAEKNDVFVLMDEAYSDFTDGDDFITTCTLVQAHKNLIVVNSLSKNFGMSGWRIGYAIASETIISKMNSLNQHLVTCAPTILQSYVEENFNRILLACDKELSKLLKKRKKVKKLLEKYELNALDGAATFYFFVNTNLSTDNVDRLVNELLLEDGISVVPGSAYGDSTGSFIRISCGTETLSRIEYALSKIKMRLLKYG